jgi:hypothetical protein
LGNIDFIEGLNSLEKILLMYMSKITYFPKMDKLEKIKRITLYECNRLEDINELKKLDGVKIKVWGKMIKYEN